jgi:hypothetical protein
MEKMDRIFSGDGARFIDVMQSKDGSYLLRKFVRKYDPDEERTYEVRELPDPAGRYGDVDAAVAEARRLLG